MYKLKFHHSKVYFLKGSFGMLTRSSHTAFSASLRPFGVVIGITQETWVASHTSACKLALRHREQDHVQRQALVSCAAHTPKQSCPSCKILPILFLRESALACPARQSLALFAITCITLVGCCFLF